MICPKCGEPIKDWDNLDGGWCEHCEEWWPPDIVKEWLEENE